jgi:hypothetical protein
VSGVHATALAADVAHAGDRAYRAMFEGKVQDDAVLPERLSVDPRERERPAENGQGRLRARRPYDHRAGGRQRVEDRTQNPLVDPAREVIGRRGIEQRVVLPLPGVETDLVPRDDPT